MIDRDLLAAYCDGETSPEDNARVEAALEADPTVLAELEAIMETRARVAGAFDSYLEEPAPQRTIDLVRRRLAEPSSNLAFFPSRRAGLSSLRGRLVWPSSVAAALVAGVFAGLQFSGPPDAVTISPARDAAIGGDLAQALDTTVSGQPATTKGGVVRVSLSFAAADGAPCRQFTLAGSRGVMSGLACRDAEVWRMRAATLDPTPVESEFRTAVGAGQDLVSQMADGLIAGEPFDQSEEARWIRGGWVNSGTPAR